MKKLLLILLFLPAFLVGQTNSIVDFDAGFGLCSRYIWRGTISNNSPNIQPYFSVGTGGLALMAGGSYAIAEPYGEVDLYLSYTYGGLTVSVNDYFLVTEDDMAVSDFSDFNRNTTTHLVESSLMYNLKDNGFPLSITAAVMFHGADLNQDGEQNYSSYCELAYLKELENSELSFILGGTFNKGYYSDKASVVNLGASYVKAINVTEQFQIPVHYNVIYNPASKNAFFVLAMFF